MIKKILRPWNSEAESPAASLISSCNLIDNDSGDNASLKPGDVDPTSLADSPSHLSW